MRRRHFLGAVDAMIVLLLPSCSRRPRAYRYWMAVMVDMPEGARTWSSVIEVRTHNAAAFPGPNARGIRTHIRGEMVGVDLPGGETLFAFLTGEPERAVCAAGYTWALLPARPDPGDDAGALENNTWAPRRVEGTAELPAYLMPLVARFGDIDDPTSCSAPKLAAGLGPGVARCAIAVKMTDDRVTKGTEERLPWFEARMKRCSLRPANTGDPLEYRALARVIATDFASRQ